MRTRLDHWPAARWIVASVPFWVMAPRHAWAEFAALGLVLVAIVVTAVGPTLPGRRQRGGTALPHLASGPLTPVAPRSFPGARQSTTLRVLAYLFALLTVILGALALGGGDAALLGGLAMSSAIIAVTFAFSHWFAGRLRLRIDEKGLHSRVFFREESIKWNEVAGLSLRYVFMPGMGVRVVYHVVQSPEREIAFPGSMANAAELKTSIEAATGLRWPPPEITPTL